MYAWVAAYQAAGGLPLRPIVVPSGVEAPSAAWDRNPAGPAVRWV